MAAATPAATALPSTSGGSRGVSDTSAGTGASEETISASLAADVSPATAGGAPGSPTTAAEAPVSRFAVLQQPADSLQECHGRQALGGWTPQRAPWLQGQQPYMPAPGGVCCIAPWANDVGRTAAPFVSSRGGPSDRVEDSVAAASASATAAAAALYPDEAPLLCCEKKIRTVRDLGFWMSSSSYSHYVGFLRRLSLAVIDKKAWRYVPETLARRPAAAGPGGTPAAAAEATSTAAAVGASSAVASSETSSSQDNQNSSRTTSRSPNAGASSTTGLTNTSSSSSGDSCSTVRHSHDPLRLLEEFKENKRNCDSRNRSSSRATDTSCNTLSAEPDAQQRRSSTEALSTSTAGTAATEEMIEAALVTGHAEAKQRAAALAAAAQEEGLHVSEAVVQLLELLQQLLVWVDDIKPVEQPMRFGNRAFRSWLQRLENCCQRLLTPLIPALPRPPPAAMLCETIEEDPEREAAEAATSSPPPGMAASSTTSLGMSFTSAPSASAFADSAAVQQRAEAAADQDVSTEIASGSNSNSSSVRASIDRNCISSLSFGDEGAAETSSRSADALAADDRERDARVGSAARRAGSSSCRFSEDSDTAADRRTAAEKTHEKKKTEDGEELKKKTSAKDKEEDVGGSFVRKELLKELIDYLCHSFGDARRLDYGTGHEASFALFLLVLFEAHVLREGVDDAAIVLLVFAQYVEVCHALQRRYSLEPAGSRGAWGLDDFHFLPFLFGSAQLQDQLFISPAQVMEPAVVHEMAMHNLYFSSIEYIMQTKRGAPFSECAPMLYDISGISSWKKIHAGLLRMYEGEVLNKFPIAQHFLFGRYFPLNLLDASGSSP